MRIEASINGTKQHDKFKLAVGHVVAELGQRCLYPVYRRHHDLVPDDFKGELL